MKNCISCKQSKALSEFNKNKARKDGLQSRCRPCDQAYAKKLYHSDPYFKDRTVGRNLVNKNTNKSKMIEYLADKKCANCPESDPIVLEFDHRNPKTKLGNISEMVSSGLSWKRILEEIDKCDILCSNCHKKKTAKQFGYYKYALMV